MKVRLQPSFGFPEDFEYIAYMFVTMANGEQVKVVEKKGVLLVIPLIDIEDDAAPGITHTDTGA